MIGCLQPTFLLNYIFDCASVELLKLANVRSIVLSTWPPEALKNRASLVKTKTMDPQIHICCLFDIQLWHMIRFYHINYTNLIILRVRCRSASTSRRGAPGYM